LPSQGMPAPRSSSRIQPATLSRVAIVGDGDHGPRELGEETASSQATLSASRWVRRLIEEQHVRPLQQHPAQGHAAPLATGELGHVRVRRRQPQRVHGDLERPVELPQVLRVDLVLQLALLLEELVHLVGRQVLAEAHGDVVEAIEQRLALLHRLGDVAEHVFFRIELRLLREEADLMPSAGRASPWKS